MTNTFVDKERLNKIEELQSKNREAVLTSERNRLYVVIFSMIAVIIVLLISNFNFAAKSIKNTEFVYVKLYKDGSWQVDVTMADGERPLLKNTIDHSFDQFLRARYGLRPETLRTHYAEAGVFMSDAMYKDFLLPVADGGFGALEKVEAIEKNTKTSNIKKIKFNFSDHYDLVDSIVDGQRGTIYRSNLHFTRTVEDNSGIKIKPDEKLILRVQWQLLPMDDMKNKDSDWIRVNPLGIELIETSLLKDPSA